MTRMMDRLIYGIARTGMGSVKGQIISLIPGPLYHGGVQAAVNPLYVGGTVVPMLKFDAAWKKIGRRKMKDDSET